MSLSQLVLAIALEISVDITNQGAIAAYCEFVQNLHDTPFSLILDSVFHRSLPKSIAHSVANAV